MFRENARDGTRGNLLSAALLDGAQYPTIRLRATDVRAAGEAYDVGVEVTLKGSTYAVRVPVTVQAPGRRHRRQRRVPAQADRELGLKPFSVAMGALVVLDDMRVRFDVTARSGSQ